MQYAEYAAFSQKEANDPKNATNLNSLYNSLHFKVTSGHKNILYAFL